MAHIAEKNIAAVDLNLLTAFEALLEEGNVTRAGLRIGLAQPSMSSALRRLRALFDDELFVRDAGAMRPTPRALQLAGPVREALRQVRLALNQGVAFDPSTSRASFRLAATDYGSLIVVPLLARALREQAPGVDLKVRPIADARQAVEQLERGEIDAVIGGHLPLSRNASRHPLFAERFVCVCAAENAAAYAGLDLAAYAALPHALFSASGGDGSPAALDAALARKGLHRRVAVTLPHAMALPVVIAGTDLVAALAERLARRMAGIAGIAILPLPVPAPLFGIDLLYTQEGLRSPAVRWIVGLLAGIGEALAQEGDGQDAT